MPTYTPFNVTQGTVVHFMIVSLTLWLEYSQLIIRQSLSLLVIRMLITLSGWSRSLVLIGKGVMLFIFAISPVVSSWFVDNPTHIAGNRLDIVMTEAPDIVDVFVGTPLGTSDHCFVSRVLRVEQSVLEYNARITVFLRHRTNWDTVSCTVRSFTWSTILRSADPLNGFDRAIGEVIGRFVPTTVLRSRSGDKQWFDANCWRAYDAKHTSYRAWCRTCSADHLGSICALLVVRRRESMVLQGVALSAHQEYSEALHLFT